MGSAVDQLKGLGVFRGLGLIRNAPVWGFSRLIIKFSSGFIQFSRVFIGFHRLFIRMGWWDGVVLISMFWLSRSKVLIKNIAPKQMAHFLESFETKFCVFRSAEFLGCLLSFCLFLCLLVDLDFDLGVKNFSDPYEKGRCLVHVHLSLSSVPKPFFCF